MRKIRATLWGKILLIVLAMLFLTGAVVCLRTAVYCQKYSSEFNANESLDNKMENIILEDVYNFAQNCYYRTTYKLSDLVELEICNIKGKSLYKTKNYDSQYEKTSEVNKIALIKASRGFDGYKVYQPTFYYGSVSGLNGADNKKIVNILYSDELLTLIEKTNLEMDANLRTAKDSIYTLIPGGIVAGIIGLALYLYFILGLCRNADKSVREYKNNFFIPFELILLAVAGLGYLAYRLYADITFEMVEKTIIRFTLVSLIPIACIILLIGTFVYLIKRKLMYKTSLIHCICRAIKTSFTVLLKGINALNVYSKIIFLLVIATVVEYIFFAMAYSQNVLMFGWFLIKTIEVFIMIRVARSYERLQNGIEEVCVGNTKYCIDTEGMTFNLKKSSEAINGLSEELTRIIDQSVKDERTKAELITNVSHDIKTPLTSIINYATLISSDDYDEETKKEYATVLVDKSVKLKRLLDDLVEASKAFSGNLDVQLTECGVSLFISQAAAEYEEKLNEASLRIVTSVPEENMSIMADGRRMWRIFENIMGNICKYSQPGTRVFLTLERKDNDAVIIFKNTSREELDISPEELMERFVRGDASRNTEGHGLGLSIAKTMAELQNGTFSIEIDGDLFKSILRFPLVDLS